MSQIPPSPLPPSDQPGGSSPYSGAPVPPPPGAAPYGSAPPYGSTPPAPGTPGSPGTPISYQPGVPAYNPADNKKLVSGILAILLGGLGIHKFYLGMNTPGIIMLVAGLVVGGITCGFGYGLVALVGLIEGIIYLTKTDEQFHQEYVVNKKQWF